MASFGILIIFISSFLLWYDPILAIISILIIGGGYGLFYWFFQQPLHLRGQERFKSTTERFTIVSEAFGSIKETKLLGLESSFEKRFTPPSLFFSHAMTMQQVIKDLPRYIFETLAFGSLLGVILFLIAKGRNLQDIVPIAGMYAFSGYRLLPAINDIYRSIAQIRFSTPVLETIYNQIRENQVNKIDKKILLKNNISTIDKLNFEKKIELKKVSFSYPNTSELAIKDISLKIKKGSFIGIVGETGSGKTTLVDIILGLFSPQKGQLFIDDTPIGKLNIRSWQDKIGYVPQEIFLTDENIASNIAFGIPKKEINMEAVEEAAKIANLHDFIIDRLPEKYNSIVGEKGVRLSGGQRQRIGIARSLYRNPDLIVMDEATSNLDQATEATVYEAIQQTIVDKTVIMIAHRLQRVKDCDFLYVLEKGKIVGKGIYDQLVQDNSIFKNMVDS
tara:strand:- start:452 stop:1792 length:1341 start_codon:yes stop_codon:yes gene_type:complete